MTHDTRHVTADNWQKRRSCLLWGSLRTLSELWVGWVKGREHPGPAWTLVCLFNEKEETKRCQIHRSRTWLSWYEGTVDTLITHSLRWTVHWVQAMGFQGLWVAGGGKKISTQKSCRNFEKILFSVLVGPFNWKPNNQCHLSKSLLMYSSSAELASWLSKDLSGEEEHSGLISEHLVISRPDYGRFCLASRKKKWKIINSCPFLVGVTLS